MSHILGTLYLGDRQDAETMTDVDLVVNCTSDIPFYAKPDAIKIRLPVEDNGDPDQDVKLYNLISDDNIFHQIELHLMNEKKVLIHCRMGAQRSAATLACFLLFHSFHILDQPMNVNTVIKFIKNKRKIAFHRGINFIRTIEHYDMLL